VSIDPTGLAEGPHEATLTIGPRATEKSTVVALIVVVRLIISPALQDSVWVTSGSGKVGDTVDVDVDFCNNHPASGISVGLKYSSYNVHVAGISFAGSRVDGLSLNSASIDSAARTICLMAAPNGSEPDIAVGCGRLATISFVIDSAGNCPNPEITVIDSATVGQAQGCYPLLTDTTGAPVTPSFVAGAIEVICAPRICGVVSDTAGNPLGSAFVQLWSSYPGGTLLEEIVTGPDGHFCFMNIDPSGTYDLRIFHVDYCTYVLSGIAPTGASLLNIELMPLPFVAVKPVSADYWSADAKIDGVPLMVGDVITAVDPRGFVCGKTIVTAPGAYLIHVMGDDPTTLVPDGAMAGDEITFYLNCTCAMLVPAPWNPWASTQFDANFNCAQRTAQVPVCDPWTLLSFNVFPTDPSLSAVLQSIDGQYTNVFTSTCADGPLSWDVARPAPLNDLNSMDPFHGYWLKSTGPAGPISITGVPVPVSTPIGLCEGWNLVSYLPDQPDTFTHALNSIDGQYSHIFGFECGIGYASWDANRPAFLNDVNCLKPMLGYWIKTTTSTVLTYPSSGYVCNEGGPILAKPVNLLTRVTPTPWVTDFWSVANTSKSGLRAGDRLTVRTSGGVVCGECVVGTEGAFMVHVYGDDPTTDRVEGAVAGEELRFEVNDAAASVESGSAIWTERQSTELTVAVAKSSPVPSDYALLQNYPNPFNPSTIIEFRLPVAGEAKLSIYNVLGQTVRVLFSGSLSEGAHSFEWNGQNENGQVVQSGIYFYRLDTPSWSDVKKMTFLK